MLVRDGFEFQFFEPQPATTQKEGKDSIELEGLRRTSWWKWIVKQKLKMNDRVEMKWNEKKLKY